MKKNKKQSILGIISAVIFCYLAAFAINNFVNNNFKFAFDLKLLISAKTFIYMVVLDLVAILLFLAYKYKHWWNGARTSKIIKGEIDEIVGNLENSHFQSDVELQKNFRCYTLENLSAARAGIPIRAVEKNGTIDIVMADLIQTLLLGTTGSGKTTGCIDTFIQILSRTRDKPTLVISDPKAELYARHAKSLEKRGYCVNVIDIRNPYNSVRWNPLSLAFELHQKAKTLDKEEAQILEDEAYDIIHDIAMAISPITNKDDGIWESGTSNFIAACLLAMLYDERMTKEQFNFYNLMRLANLKDVKLHRYFRDCKNAQARALANQVLESSDKTKSSYKSTIADKLSIFNDNSICAFTSQNELDFEDLTKKPTALFLQIPDEKQSRHIIASLFISQTYKNLVAIANKQADKKLSKPILFLIDEAGNLPPINNLSQMVTVGRGRNIFFVLVFQSYSQLFELYGNRIAETIRSNCNVQIFIGTNDAKTTKEFSQLCGNYSLRSTSVGTNPKEKDLSAHISLKERPLIYPSELARLNNDKNLGNAIICVFGYAPIKTKFTPSFKTKLYHLQHADQQLIKPRYFDAEKCAFQFVEDCEFSESKIRTEHIKEQIVKLDCMQNENKVYVLNLFDKGEYNRAKTLLQAALDCASPQQSESIRKIIEHISKL